MGKGKKKDPLEKRAKVVRQFKEIYESAQSDLCEVRNSVIHGSGVYAAQDIVEGARVIEYVGEYISKEESERRAWDQFAKHEENNDAAVYIFTLNDKWDIDGNVPWNTARLINHSCDPNCEAWTEEDQIVIYALRDIKEGEELTFDYGFDIESYEDHPCLCGSDNCIGYIVSQEQWPELKKRMAEAEEIAKEAEEAVSS